MAPNATDPMIAASNRIVSAEVMFCGCSPIPHTYQKSGERANWPE